MAICLKSQDHPDGACYPEGVKEAAETTNLVDEKEAIHHG